jgi:DAK2 domain fusion protein YloV
MTLRFCDGATFYRAMIAAVATLDRHAAEVDSLNVFPVPDGDTGRNMLVTMKVALEHAEALDGPERTLTGVAEALAHGALMGARGNSGVILSQVMRGIADGVNGMRRADGLAMAHALRCGSRAADAAVHKPVEGTILTVVRSSADAAVGAAEAEPTLLAALSAAVEAAAEAVIRTPDQLPVLRDAGVVDAGGRGFELLLRGILMGMAESPGPGSAVTTARPRLPADRLDEEAGWGYETMYLLAARVGTSLDIDRMRTQLQTMGDSVLVVGDARLARVHLHSERPDLAIGYGLRRGTISRVTVENMDLLSAGEREERAAELLSVAPSELARVGAMGGPMPGRPVTAPAVAGRVAGVAASGATSDAEGGHGIEGPVSPFAVVAVAAGAGIAQAFEAAGVAALVRGGQGENPSTGDLVAAIHDVAAENVVILPNNPNVRLAAQQAAALSPGTSVHVVPTRNAAEGLAAMLAVDPRAEPAANVERMRHAAASVRTFSVTHAVRDARLGGRKVKTGDAIALDPDDGLIAAGKDRIEVAVDAARHVADGAELVTIHYGADADLDEAQRLAGRLSAALPGVEVEVHHGGQPHYAFLVAAE